MSLSAQDIVALARAGFSAEQISSINAESTVSTQESTLSTESTLSPAKPEEPTVSTIPVEVQEAPEAPAPDPAKPVAAAQDPTPTMQDLMAKLAAMETRLQGAAIQSDQQPGQPGPLTGQDVLARILDPTNE